MEILIGCVFIWCYTVAGFAVLAMLEPNIELFGTGDITDAGIVTILFWPIVVYRTTLRTWRIRRVMRELRKIPDAAPRAVLAYGLLGRLDAERLLQEIAQQQKSGPRSWTDLPDDVRARYESKIRDTRTPDRRKIMSEEK